MATVIVSLRNDPKLYIYDSILKTIKSQTRKDTSYRCYDKFELRIDVMPNTRYHKTYFIVESILDRLRTEVEIDRPSRIKSREVVYGLLIADSLKGYDKNKNFLYNAIATQKYDRDYILDTMNFLISKDIVKCTPAGSEKSVFSTSLFDNYSIDTYTQVRKILGVNDAEQDISSILKEFNLSRDLQYAGSCYYDDGKITLSELYELRSVII